MLPFCLPRVAAPACTTLCCTASHNLHVLLYCRTAQDLSDEALADIAAVYKQYRDPTIMG